MKHSTSHIQYLALAFLAGIPLAFSLAKGATVAETAHMTLTAPRQDGSETITIRYKDATGAWQDVEAEITVNGKKQGDDDDEQTTPHQKATKIAAAINEQDPDLGATAILDSVTIGCAGCDMKTFRKTNHTNEGSRTAITIDATQIGMAEFVIAGSAAGYDLDGQPSFIEIGVGGYTQVFAITAKMPVADLRAEIRDTFATAGFRVGLSGDTVQIVVPPDENGQASAWHDLTDSTLMTASGVTTL